MKKIGLIVILYAFAHSFFGVGSIKNALVSALIGTPFRTFGALYGLSWIALWISGALLLMRNNVGYFSARIAAGAMAGIQLASIAMMGNPVTMDMTSVFFRLSSPVYGLFLFLMLPRLSGEQVKSHYPKINHSLMAIIAAGFLPWIALIVFRISGNEPLMLAKPLGFFIGVFMSLWCILPCGAFLLTISVLPERFQTPQVLAAGFTGTAAACLYAYGLIWAQHGNSFIMALMQPGVFAAQAIGIFAGMLWTSGFTHTRLKLRK